MIRQKSLENRLKVAVKFLDSNKRDKAFSLIAKIVNRLVFIQMDEEGLGKE